MGRVCNGSGSGCGNDGSGNGMVCMIRVWLDNSMRSCNRVQIYTSVNELLRRLKLALPLHRLLDSCGISWRFP